MASRNAPSFRSAALPRVLASEARASRRRVRSVSNAKLMASRALSPKIPVPQNSDATAKPHSAVPNSGSIDRICTRPIAVSEPRGTIAKQTHCPARRSRRVHATNFSNPSMLAGGGEMNRVTSSVASMTNNARASLVRRSRNVTSDPASVGRPCRQSLAISGDGSPSGIVEPTVSSLPASWYGTFSIRKSFSAGNTVNGRRDELTCSSRARRQPRRDCDACIRKPLKKRMFGRLVAREDGVQY
jgi:hypothetical protein